MSHDDRSIPRFAIGESVRVFSTGQLGKVAHHITRPDGQHVLIVDIPHGQATLRRHFEEADLELIPDIRSTP